MTSVIKTIVRAMLPARARHHLRALLDANRLRNAYYGRELRLIHPIVLQTGETHNFTYDLADSNIQYLSEMIAVATRRPAATIDSHIKEAISDLELRQHFDRLMLNHVGQRTPDNVVSPFGRRLGWYATVRATKPKVVVETGVERGHGALILCAALLRNAAEGFPGRYFGTDINPKAGWLLAGKYAEAGTILYGDSIQSLQKFSQRIDLFINDSDHSAEYEADEYETIAAKLSTDAIILGDNAHSTDKLAIFSRNTGRHFLMFNERPKDHWYPGAGIGISFPAH